MYVLSLLCNSSHISCIAVAHVLSVASSIRVSSSSPAITEKSAIRRCLATGIMNLIIPSEVQDLAFNAQKAQDDLTLPLRSLQFVGNGIRSFNVVLPGRVLHTMNSISARWGDYVAIERCPCSPCHRREFNIISKNKGPLHETPIAPPVDENEVTLDRGVLHKYLSFNIAGYRVIFGRTTQITYARLANDIYRDLKYRLQRNVDTAS